MFNGKKTIQKPAKKQKITITRKINSSTNVIDKIYINNKLQFEQSNITSKNSFGAITVKLLKLKVGIGNKVFVYRGL